MLPPPVAEIASQLGLPLLQAESVNDEAAVEAVHHSGPEVGVVCAFGQLIREPLLSDPVMLNVHPSLLPRWRGAAPIERAIMAGDAVTGVSVMRLTEGLDSGPVAIRSEVAIEPGTNFGALSTRLAGVGGELIVEALDAHAKGRLELAEQDDAEATYAEKITPAERRLDPWRPADELERRVRALTPHIGAYIDLEDGGRLGIRAAAIADEGGEAGRIEVIDGSLLLRCSPGSLRLEVVQPAGSKPMPVDAFLRGHAPPRAAVRDH
jgi:methionyl-tRNA formyltransferase